MAKQLLFAVRDSASEAFMRPFPAVARGQAVRSFTDEVNAEREGNALFFHPEDFELWLVGYFDDVSGLTFQAENGSELVVRGKDVSRRLSNAQE